jgi:hypothetical protein
MAGLAASIHRGTARGVLDLDAVSHLVRAPAQYGRIHRIGVVAGSVRHAGHIPRALWLGFVNVTVIAGAITIDPTIAAATIAGACSIAISYLATRRGARNDNRSAGLNELNTALVFLSDDNKTLRVENKELETERDVAVQSARSAREVEMPVLLRQVESANAEIRALKRQLGQDPGK